MKIPKIFEDIQETKDRIRNKYGEEIESSIDTLSNYIAMFQSNPKSITMKNLEIYCCHLLIFKAQLAEKAGTNKINFGGAELCFENETDS